MSKRSKRNGGRYVAYRNERTGKWEVRIVDRRGSFSTPAALLQDYSSYTDAVRAIRVLEGDTHAQT